MYCLSLSEPYLQVERSPFVERLLKKGYEVLYLIEPVDEYCIQSLPEFDGKKFQNVAKEGIKLDDSEKAKERKEAIEKDYEPLIKWLKDEALKDKVLYNVKIDSLSKCFIHIRNHMNITMNKEH